MRTLAELIAKGRESGASDLHLEAGSPALFRVRGDLQPAGDPWNGAALRELAESTLGSFYWAEFLERKSADLSKTIAGTRCRINCFQTMKGVSLSIRLLSSFRNTITGCNLHPDLRKLIDHDTGLVIVSGPTGSGKSTTLAALIEEMNQTRRANILTIESPIEYFFQNRQSFIRQREVPTHSPSFEQAIVDSMREDPDALVIGEMRTPDVMRLTINAAETGHLVLATLHSSTCAEAITRLCLSFAPEMQGSIRAQIADCLIGVVCQRLTYLSDQKLVVPVLEIMMANSAVKASIRSGAFSQLSNVIQTGAEDGMYSFERYTKWLQQKRDFVRPGTQPLLASQDEPAPPAAEELPRARTPATPSAAKAPAAGRSPSRADTLSKPADPDRIEIQIAEDDLESLARRIAGDAADEE